VIDWAARLKAALAENVSVPNLSNVPNATREGQPKASHEAIGTNGTIGSRTKCDSGAPAPLDAAAVGAAPAEGEPAEPEGDGWSADDWRAYFAERAGIAEFTGGLLRAEAEARAFACCVGEWLNRNPVRSPPGRCHRCDEADNAHDPLLPLGTESTGHAWLHSRCWPAWRDARKAEALAAMAAMGIHKPRMFR
jgi:hypothetical protein